MRKSCYSLHNVWTVKNHKKDIRNRRKKIWYDEDGNTYGGYVDVYGNELDKPTE